jgi:hypothetical protein
LLFQSAEAFESRELNRPPNCQLEGAGLDVDRHSDIVSTATGQEDPQNIDTYDDQYLAQGFERRKARIRRVLDLFVG